MVYQCLGQRVGEAIKVKIVNRSTGKEIISRWLTKIPGTLSVVQGIDRTFWNGNKFYVTLFKTRWNGEPSKTLWIEIPSSEIRFGSKV